MYTSKKYTSKNNTTIKIKIRKLLNVINSYLFNLFIHQTSRRRIQPTQLVNAIIHNDYRITEPQVSFFDDRLEIISHGGLPFGLSKEQFFSGISKPRNENLIDIFVRLGIVEHTGHGVPTIISKYGKEAFEVSDNYIKVVIPFNKEALDN